MSVELQITEGNQAIPPAGGNVVARLGVSSDGDDLSVTEWDGGSDGVVATVLGYGPLTEDTARAVRITGERAVAVKVPATIAAVLGPVLHRNAADDGAGTGPLASVSGSPTDTFNLRAIITKAGALGVAKARVALDGFTYGPEIVLEAQLPATLRGTVDLSAAGNLATLLNTKTFIVNADGGGAQTVTFAGLTGSSTPADVAAQIEAQSTANARIIAGRYLEVYGTTLGPTGTLDVGAGTANDELGFAADPPAVTGTASTYGVPKTGVTIAWPAGNYIEGETYTAPTQAPRFTIDDMNDALDVLRESGVTFGIVFVDQVPVDGADLLAFAQALDAKLASWHNAEADRIFPGWVLPSPLGDTDDFATNDTAVRTALAGYTTLLSFGIGHGDMYCTGHEFVGLFRRSLAVPLCERFAGARLSADPGNGAFPALPQCSVIGPDGETKARDELFAVVKMQDHGFTVGTRRDNRPRIKAGATRAGVTSKFFFPGVLRMAYLAAHTVYQRALQFENADLALATDGSLVEPIAAAIDKVFDKDLKEALVQEEHASAVRTTVDRTKRAAPNGKYPLTIVWAVQMKGQVRDVSGTISVVTELTLS